MRVDPGIGLRPTVMIAAIAIAGAIAAACRPIPLPEGDCPPSAEFFTQDARLAAMLSVHTYAYYRGEMKADGRGPHDIRVTPLTDAVRTLRCDPDPIALSRRRRAIAKLLAYDWPGKRYRKFVCALGADVKGIVATVREEAPAAQQADFRFDRKLLEYWILRVTAAHPFLVRLHPAMADGPTVTPTQTPAVPTPTVTLTPTPILGPPVGVTITMTPPGVIFAPAPPTPVRDLCAQGWRPEATPASYQQAGVVHSYALISVPGFVRSSVAKNIDPQSWDECGLFWPRPAMTPGPPDSATLADVTTSTCVVQLPQDVQPTAVPAGSLYPQPHAFYEHFRCVVPPCDSEFRNILSVFTDHVQTTFANNTYTAHHVHYTLPVCQARTNYDGAISGRVQNNTKILTSVDWGNLDAWEALDPVDQSRRTYIQAEKHVAFSSFTYTNGYDAILKYTELNEQLAEIVCCRKGP